MGTLLYATPLQSTLLYSTQTPRKPARKNTLAGLQVLLRSHLPPKKVGPLGKGNGNACKRPSDQVGEPLRFKGKRETTSLVKAAEKCLSLVLFEFCDPLTFGGWLMVS